MKRTWLWVGAAVVALAFLYLPTLGISGGQILVFLLVLLCPLMHLFGMRRHGDHGSGDSGAAGTSAPDKRQVGAPDRET
jgi:hypothetical protein